MRAIMSVQIEKQGRVGVPLWRGGDQRTVEMNFLEGRRVFSQDDLRDNDITRYQVTRFYKQQILKSGYYEQLKYIVEPSLREFTSPGGLDTTHKPATQAIPYLQHTN